MRLVAVTSCPTGIAHSQVAAENLEQTAEELDHDIKVEVQGAMGAENELSEADIEAADAAIIASDTSVSQDRFSGIPLIKGTVKDVVNDAVAVIADAIEAADGDVPATQTESEGTDTTDTGFGQQRRRGGDRSKSLVARLKRLFSCGPSSHTLIADLDRPHLADLDGVVSGDAPSVLPPLVVGVLVHTGVGEYTPSVGPDKDAQHVVVGVAGRMGRPDRATVHQ
jgi:PTS system fructose-specific IIB component